MPELPIASCLDSILQSVARDRPVVLKAPPGAGKTTGVPMSLLASGCSGSAGDAIPNGQILLIQPRRLAARSAALRLAKLRGCGVGEEVGYHVRFDRKVGPRTRLITMTTGMLLRRLQDDPLLENVACVILDEFHERSLDIDLALGMLQRIRQTLRPDLKLIVMSATLQPEPIVSFLGDADGIVSEGRSFEVQICYANNVSAARLEDQIAAVLPEALRRTDGHLLVFLPGVGEIRRAGRAIDQSCAARDCQLLELYGDLSPQDQDRVIGGSADRKVILSTNVAETSVTIPGVTGVIDSGLARVLRYDDKVGLPKLEVEKISQSSAEQRAGRAGRTSPGTCWRLWPAAMHRGRPEIDTPEILRADFSGAALTLAAWGERDAMDFPWLTPPREEAVERANSLLSVLGAITETGVPTKLGQRMAAQPLHPRLARFMVEADRLGIVDEAAIAAALLTERSPFQFASPSAGQSTGSCDVSVRVQALQANRGGDRDDSIHTGAAKNVFKVAKQLGRIRSGSSASTSTRDSIPDPDALSKALLCAYPDRLARRRSPGADRGLMVGGRGVKIDRNSVACRANSAEPDRDELFLCLDVDSSGTEARVRMATQIDVKWLPPEQKADVDEAFFNPSTKSVVMRRRTYFGDLMLAETPIECTPSPQTAELLAREARLNQAQVFPAGGSDVDGFIARIRFLETHFPDSGLPVLDQDRLDSILLDLCQSRTSFDQLRKAPWLDHLAGIFDYQQLQLLDREAPARMQVPSGNSHAIHYEPSKPPAMKVKLQELFGWADTPRIAGGRVPLQLHLLGPNRRPQQITEDLANFWKTTYEVVRKELRRRYPKHHWPEDPMSATATRNGLKKRT